MGKGFSGRARRCYSCAGQYEPFSGCSRDPRQVRQASVMPGVLYTGLERRLYAALERILARFMMMHSAKALKKMRSLAKPAIALGRSGARKRGWSKLGGFPDLPASLAWPVGRGSPLGFVAQLDLGALPVSEDLRFMPDTGMLYVFFDQEQSVSGLSPDDRDAWRVLYTEDAPVPSRRRPPPGLDAGLITREVFLEGRKILSFPSPERAGINDAGMDDAEAEDFYDQAIELLYQPFDGEPQHQLGGLPNPVLSDSMEMEVQLALNGIDYAGFVEEEEAAPFMGGVGDWLLLLQIASDDEAQLHWGDEGCLYFWIRKQDLVARNFDLVWMRLQSY